MAFWRTKPRTPTELVRALKDSTLKLDASPYGSDARQKSAEDITKTLAQMKILLCGDATMPTQPETTAQLAQEFYSNDIFLLLLTHIGQYEFEARKDVVAVFTHLLKRQIGSRLPTVEYLNSRPDVLICALQGYDNPDVALNTGQILHELLRHETLAKLLLNSGHVYDFKDYIERTTFGIACDAMTSFKELTTKHKPMVADYLERNYDDFFGMMNELISSENYVTKRQSIKLLAELLLDKANYLVMTRYISSDENLKTIMLLLREKAKNIQHEAFHVFKVFVANPRKAPNIESILRRNKNKLLIFLKAFQNDRDDDQFNDEKQFLIQQISAL